MMKCYATGLILNYENAFVLDLVEAKKLQRDLKNKLDALNKIIEVYNGIDEVEIENWRSGEITKKKCRRLVCKTVADALNQTDSGRTIFVKFDEYLKNRNSKFNKKGGKND
ncbi:MAG TPA: hypothetical protein PLB16_11390 [bacterium]|nr:hypothetical protein [bacterium]